MVGRARVEKGDRVNLYLKRFNAQEVENRINFLEEQRDAYHAYNLAGGSDVFTNKFHTKFYHGNVHDWKTAGHLFTRITDSPVYFPSLHYQYSFNKIAKSYIDKLVLKYRSVLEEMKQTDGGQQVNGQKYLEYQLSWFGKNYNHENDITLMNKVSAENELLNFLKSYATAGTQMFKAEQEKFRIEFTKLYDKAYPRRDKNTDRKYGLKITNTLLKACNMNYRVDSIEAKRPEGKRQYWTVVRFERP
jgi:hypothetical protein